MRKYWKYIVMVGLALTLTFSIYSCNKEKSEKEHLINEKQVAQTIEKVEEGRKEVDKREREVYPKIDKRLSEIDNTLKANKKKVSDEIQKASINDIAHQFTLLGYSSSVRR